MMALPMYAISSISAILSLHPALLDSERIESVHQGSLLPKCLLGSMVQLDVSPVQPDQFPELLVPRLGLGDLPPAVPCGDPVPLALQNGGALTGGANA
mmetsp:Transcript_31820/g.95258  ORF Transcript_31820/g.95258 Transcript_31820/m.95258 type:complete len:98 (-) Transcript_31820:745-1038(-)